MARNLIIWLLVLGVLLMVINSFGVSAVSESVPYSSFRDRVEQGSVRSVVISGQDLTVVDQNGSSYSVVGGYDVSSLEAVLMENGVEVKYAKPEQEGILSQLLVASFPILIIILVFLFLYVIRIPEEW